MIAWSSSQQQVMLPFQQPINHNFLSFIDVLVFIDQYVGIALADFTAVFST